MILVLAHWPSDSSLEGMGLRVREADLLFGDQHRTYIQLKSRSWSPLPETQGESAERRYLWLNPKNLFHVLWLFYFLLTSKLIYAHSVLNLGSFWIQKFLRLLPVKKLVLDVHGVVPEEFEYTGDYNKAAFFARTEAASLQHCLACVYVTHAMETYIRTKYPNSTFLHFVVPTDTSLRAPDPTSLLASKKPLILYAGGTQKWQLFDETLVLMTQVPSTWEKLILTYALDEASSKVREHGLSIRCEHKVGEELRKEYLEARLGVALREDNIVNRVACPTKLVDYLKFGIIPVVRSTKVGDFESLGCPFVLESKIEDVMKDPARLDQLSEQALASYKKLRSQISENASKLRSFCAQFQ